MPKHQEVHQSPYSVAQLYALVTDIEKYPEFLPWVAAARILEQSPEQIKAELRVKYKGFRESYTSLVTLSPPDAKGTSATIHVEMLEGPFRHLFNHWVFTKNGTQTTIDFLIDFHLKSSLLERLMGSFFERAFFKMLAAFESRADSLYGK